MSPTRGPGVLVVAIFFGSFAWSFVYVSLPFHVQAITALDTAATLRWTGWILGITPLVTVVVSPLWGRWADRWDVRKAYVLVEMLQATGFVGMALARTLPELFLSRFVLGFVGAASTFAFIIAGRSPDGGEVRRQVAALQSAMTVGQVIGPLAGAIAAARLGFRGSFVLGAAVLFACAGLVRWGVSVVSQGVATRAIERPLRHADVLAAALIVLGGSTQVFFLPSVLPEVLIGLGVPPSRTLEIGGVLIFASGAAAALGSMGAPRLGELGPERRLVAILLAASSAFLAALAGAGTVWSYGVVRFLQVLCVAPVFPLVVARVAQRATGQVIGFVNSARLAAAFIGPVLATSVLAWTSPLVLYLILAGIGVGCLPLVGKRR